MDFRSSLRSEYARMPPSCMFPINRSNLYLVIVILIVLCTSLGIFKLNQELDQTKQELNQTKHELYQTQQSLEDTKLEKYWADKRGDLFHEELKFTWSDISSNFLPISSFNVSKVALDPHALATTIVKKQQARLEYHHHNHDNNHDPLPHDSRDQINRMRQWASTCSTDVLSIHIQHEEVDQCDTYAKCNVNSSEEVWEHCPVCLGEKLITTSNDLKERFCGPKNINTNAIESDDDLHSKHIRRICTDGYAMAPAKDWGMKRFPTCAIVGYASNLRGAKCGPEIEQEHHAIFRSNCSPPSKDPPTIVGNTTTIEIWNVGTYNNFMSGEAYCCEGVLKQRSDGSSFRTLNPRSFRFLENRRVVFLSDSKMIEYAQLLESPRGKIIRRRLPVFQMYKSRVLDWTDLKIDWFRQLQMDLAPSSGWASVMLAFALCDRVDLYGFARPPELGGVWITPHHEIQQEHRAYRSLHGKTLRVLSPKTRRWGHMDDHFHPSDL